MAVSSCCAAVAASSSVVWRGNGGAELETKNVLGTTTTNRYDDFLPSSAIRSTKNVSCGRSRYDFLRHWTVRSNPVSSSVRIRRRTWEWSGRPYSVRMESSMTRETETKAKRKVAKLYVEKRQSVPLPTFQDAAGNPQHLRVFLREPEGMKCMLNTKVLRKYEDVGDGVFKCYLPMMEFLSFEVAPVLELQVDAREDGCQVDLLSCKFEGSDLIRSQNEHFSASMKNHLTWSSSSTSEEEENEDFLHVQVELDVALEVYTLPFTVLPISTVESPGRLVLQALVDRLIPVFVDQLFIDYQTWAQAQNSSPVGDNDSPGVVQLEVNGSPRV
ncbi:unnamed protein product [Calypogeia fissa]